MNKSRPRQNRLTKQEKQEIYQNGLFKDILDLEGLTTFLQSEGGIHSEYCLELVNRELTLTEEQKQTYPEKHHIIPSRLGGPDEDWNLVHVSYDEHLRIHELRYEQYQELGDRMALNPRKKTDKTTREKKAESSRKGHKTMKETGVGFWSSDVQSELGKRSGGQKTLAREVAYQHQAKDKGVYTEIFKKDLVFTYQRNEETFVFETKADYFQRTGQIKSFFLDNMDSSDPLKQVIENDKYFTSNLNKVLQSLLPNPNPLLRNKYKVWSVRFK